MEILVVSSLFVFIIIVNELKYPKTSDGNTVYIMAQIFRVWGNRRIQVLALFYILSPLKDSLVVKGLTTKSSTQRTKTMVRVVCVHKLGVKVEVMKLWDVSSWNN